MSKVVLNTVIDIISGGTPKTNVPEYWNGDIGWLSVTDFNNDLRYVYDSEKTITELGVKESNTKFLNKGDIIISARGTVGALAQIGKPMCFNQSCFGLRGKEGVLDTDFLYYSLKNYVKNIVKRSQGSVFDTINLSSFNLMEIEIPTDLQNQQKIAKVLSDLDAKIELNNKINAELEAMAKLIYDYWFVQFEFPVLNPDGTQSGDVGYKSSGGKMVWNEELKREVPEGWEVKELAEISEIKAGGDKPKIISQYKTNSCTVPIFSNGVTNEGFYGFTNEAKIFKPSITVSARGTIGYSVLRLKPFVPIIRLISITPKKSCDLQFLFHEVQRFEFENSGSVQQQLTVPQVSKLKLLIPSESIIKQFDNVASSYFLKIENNKIENQKLSELRDWLLPMLMNGQVKVGERKEKMNMSAEPEVKYGDTKTINHEKK